MQFDTKGEVDSSRRKEVKIIVSERMDLRMYFYARRQKENSCVILIHLGTSSTSIHHSLCWIVYHNISLASLNPQTCSDTQLFLVFCMCGFSVESVLVWSVYRPNRVQADPCATLYVPVHNTTVAACTDQMCRGADTVIRHKIPAALPARGAGCRDYKGSVNEGVITVKVCLHVSPVCSSLLFLLAHHQAPRAHTHAATCFLPPLCHWEVFLKEGAGIKRSRKMPVWRSSDSPAS